MSHAKNFIGKDKILEVAECLFVERGYQAVSIRDISSACKVTNAALYYYFSSKQELFLEVLRHYTEKLASKMRRAAEGKVTVEDKLEAMLSVYLQMSMNGKSFFALVSQKLPGANNSQVNKQQLIEKLFQPIEDVIQDAICRKDLQLMPSKYFSSSLLLGMLHGLIQQRKVYQKQSISRRDIKLVLDIFLRGLGRQTVLVSEND